tara:strand:- start:125 stop:358 length:234 start_codon:yes stop_codon:yes gene_type:complete
MINHCAVPDPPALLEPSHGGGVVLVVAGQQALSHDFETDVVSEWPALLHFPIISVSDEPISTQTQPSFTLAWLENCL